MRFFRSQPPLRRCDEQGKVVFQLRSIRVIISGKSPPLRRMAKMKFAERALGCEENSSPARSLAMKENNNAHSSISCNILATLLGGNQNRCRFPQRVVDYFHLSSH
jgi:hypothetical protein